MVLVVVIGIIWIIVSYSMQTGRANKLATSNHVLADSNRTLAQENARLKEENALLRQAILGDSEAQRQQALDALKALEEGSNDKGTLGSGSQPGTTTPTPRPAGRSGQPGGQPSPSTTAPPQGTTTTSTSSTTTTTSRGPVCSLTGICRRNQ